VNVTEKWCAEFRSFEKKRFVLQRGVVIDRTVTNEGDMYVVHPLPDRHVRGEHGRHVVYKRETPDMNVHKFCGVGRSNRTVNTSFLHPAAPPMDAQQFTFEDAAVTNTDDLAVIAHQLVQKSDLIVRKLGGLQKSP
jgi:hypothetical protein